MFEFYHKFNLASYNKLIKNLVDDIKKHLVYENITICADNNVIINKKYKNSLDDNLWIDLNNAYNTLYKNKDHLSFYLSNFINKNNNKSQFKFLDFFSGCGGLGLGFKNQGFAPKFINDINISALTTYYFNNNIDLDSYSNEDINILANNKNFFRSFKDIDLVLGGPPCQGFSYANQQRLIDDPRNHLYKKFLEILNLVKPKFFIMENVRGMMNKSSEILNDFRTILGEKYSINIMLLNAKNYNIPQNRERVFVIGSKKNITNSINIVEEMLLLKRNSPYFLKDALDGLPSLDPIRIKKSSRLHQEDELIKYNSGQNEYLKFINGNSVPLYLKNHINRYNNNRDILIYEKLPQGANSLHESISDIMPYSRRNHIFKDKYFKLKENAYCKTITSHMSKDCNSYIHPKQSRGLSPRESARIQSFPDNFIFFGANNKWYTQIGNAVPVKLAECFAIIIRKYLCK